MCPLQVGTTYVGLKNPGAACYLNASVHALFMCPTTRRSILEASDSDNPVLGALQVSAGLHLLCQAMECGRGPCCMAVMPCLLACPLLLPVQCIVQ
jgi:hypothetical protein